MCYFKSPYDDVMDAWTGSGHTTPINRVCAEYFPSGKVEIRIGYEDEYDVHSEITLELCESWEAAEEIMLWFENMWPTCHQYEHYRN